MKRIIIALDGPAGSGKSTTARFVAQRLGYTYIDTGAMYRAVTVAALEAHSDMSAESLTNLVQNISVELRYAPQGQRTYLNGRDVSERIREQDVNEKVSIVSAVPEVRHEMVRMQHRLGAEGGIVMDGRDIGTVVFPQADLKIFMTASIEARAERRLAELQEKANGLSAADIAGQLARRDELDSSRTASPLMKATDAIEIDTSNLSIEQQVEMIVGMAENIASAYVASSKDNEQ